MQDDTWFAPGEIHFTHITTLWLIANLGCLRAGTWPHEASNYIDLPGCKKKGGKAYFQTPEEYAAEIEERLEYTGIDGLILEAIEGWGKTDDSLARYFRMPLWSIRKRCRNALRYVASGNNRRWHDTYKRKGEEYLEFIHKTKRNR